jgi:hypothetical protein
MAHQVDQVKAEAMKYPVFKRMKWLDVTAITPKRSNVSVFACTNQICVPNQKITDCVFADCKLAIPIVFNGVRASEVRVENFVHILSVIIGLRGQWIIKFRRDVLMANGMGHLAVFVHKGDLYLISQAAVLSKDVVNKFVSLFNDWVAMWIDLYVDLFVKHDQRRLHDFVDAYYNSTQSTSDVKVTNVHVDSDIPTEYMVAKKKKALAKKVALALAKKVAVAKTVALAKKAAPAE